MTFENNNSSLSRHQPPHELESHQVDDFIKEVDDFIKCAWHKGSEPDLQIQCNEPD